MRKLSVIFLIILCFVVLNASCANSDNQTAADEDYDSPVILPPSEDMGEDYIGRLTFICDSPTYNRLGINGISFMDEEYFVSEYTDLVTDIQEISPDMIMILQSIYPITHRYRYYGNITNATITRANSWILKIAEENDCAYLDTISVLLTDEGNAKDELMLNDGLHPNEDGLQVIIDYIRTHGYIEVK